MTNKELIENKEIARLLGVIANYKEYDKRQKEHIQGLLTKINDLNEKLNSYQDADEDVKEMARKNINLKWDNLQLRRMSKIENCEEFLAEFRSLDNVNQTEAILKEKAHASELMMQYRDLKNRYDSLVSTLAKANLKLKEHGLSQVVHGSY